MNRQEIEAVVKECLASVAPDARLDDVDPAADLRELFELDSMDMLNLVVALHKRLGVDVPEAAVPRLVTLAGATDYLASRLRE